MSPYRIYIILLLFFTSFYQLSSSEKETKSEFLSKLTSGGKETLESLKTFRAKGMDEFLPRVSEILKKRSTSKEIQVAILDLYESYGSDLDTHLPDSIDDYEWYFQEKFQEEDVFVRLLNSFEKRRDRKFLYTVIPFVTHKSSEIREATYRYLNSIRDDRALPYIMELGNSEEPIYRYYYLEALQVIRDERTSVHVPKMLADLSPALRIGAIQAAENLSLKDKQAQILGMARGDSNYEVRKTATVYARTTNQRFRTDIFQGGLFDSHREVREVALESVKYFRDSSYAPAISKALEKEKHSYLSSQMLDTLMVLGSHGGGQGIANALLNDLDENVRIKAAFTASKLSAKEILLSLIGSLSNEPSVNVRVEVAKTLGHLKDKKAVPVLFDRLKDKSENVVLRKEVLSSLDKIDEPSVMPYVFDLLEDESGAFRTQIRDFMRGMLYRHHGSKLKTVALTSPELLIN